MSQLQDNPGQGNRGGQEYGEDGLHKSSRSQDSQKPRTHNEDEKQNQDDKDDEVFSPGEPEEYDSEDFATD